MIALALYSIFSPGSSEKNRHLQPGPHSPVDPLCQHKALKPSAASRADQNALVHLPVGMKRQRWSEPAPQRGRNYHPHEETFGNNSSHLTKAVRLRCRNWRHTSWLYINKLHADQPKIKIPSPPVHRSLPWKLKIKISDLPRPATKMAPALATMAAASSNASDADLETRGCSKVSWKVHPNPRYVGCHLCKLGWWPNWKYNHNHSCKSNISIFHVLLNHDVLDTMPVLIKYMHVFFIPKIKSQGKGWSQTKVAKNKLFPKISCFLPTRYTQKEHTQTKRLPFKNRHNHGLLCIAWLWTGLSKSQIQLSLK